MQLHLSKHPRLSFVDDTYRICHDTAPALCRSIGSSGDRTARQPLASPGLVIQQTAYFYASLCCCHCSLLTPSAVMHEKRTGTRFVVPSLLGAAWQRRSSTPNIFQRAGSLNVWPIHVDGGGPLNDAQYIRQIRTRSTVRHPHTPLSSRSHTAAPNHTDLRPAAA